MLTAELIDMLADIGVRYIATRSTTADHIDLLASGRRKLKIASIPLLSVENVNGLEIDDIYARQTILNLDKWQENSC